MTTKPKARKFRIRRGASASGTPQPQTGAEGDGGAEARPRPQVVSSADERAQTERQAAAARAASQSGGARSAGAQATGGQQAAGASGAAMSGDVDSAAQVASEDDIDAIRREGLTGRQLRMARRVAQKQGLAVTSDFDAVRQLRKAGIDPFQRSSVLELVVPDSTQSVNPQAGGGSGGGGGDGRHQLPQTVPSGRGGNLPAAAQTAQVPSTELRQQRLETGMAEVAKIQKDLTRRRRLRMALMLVRLAIFVGLPTLVTGYYFFAMATPMYATKSEFVIQQAEAQSSAASLGGLFQGTGLATQQDSIAVQSYLASREAMLRLDAAHDFKGHFSQDHIDPIQALPEDATNEQAYNVYEKRVKVSYDPTEGILRMEVSAADPETSQLYSEALVGYAEEQVDQLTQRLREDQMAGARDSYEAAEARRQEALQTLLSLQQELETIDPAGETAARTQQIATLQSRRQELQLELQNRLAVRRPNESQVEAIRGEIANIETLIAEIQQEAVQAADGISQAEKNTQLRLAEEDYAFQNVLVQQALTAMETARIEANRQVRYLSLSVAPVAPDEPTYPRAFEDTVLAFLIFCGIYLMVSITGSILREQVSS